MPIMHDSLPEGIRSDIATDNIGTMPWDDNEVAARDVTRQVVDCRIARICDSKMGCCLHLKAEPKAFGYLSGRPKHGVRLVEK